MRGKSSIRSLFIERENDDDGRDLARFVSYSFCFFNIGAAAAASAALFIHTAAVCRHRSSIYNVESAESAVSPSSSPLPKQKHESGNYCE